MTARERKVFVGVFMATLAFCAVAWALTTDQIWSKVYDSANTALRVNQVAS